MTTPSRDEDRNEVMDQFVLLLRAVARSIVGDDLAKQWTGAAASEIERLRKRNATLQEECESLRRTVDAQVKNLQECNHHSHTLTKLVRALRDVNADLDQKLCSGGVSGAEVVGDGSPNN